MSSSPKNFCIAIACVLLLSLAPASSAATGKTKTPSNDCATACNKLHWQVTSLCKQLCADGKYDFQVVKACVEDKPTNEKDMVACFEAKSDAGKPQTTTDFIQSWSDRIASLPIPGPLRKLGSAAVDRFGKVFSKAGAHMDSYGRALARGFGTVSGEGCSKARFPVFPKFLAHYKADSTSWNYLTQYVLFSRSADCKDGQIVFAGGEKAKGRGVLIVNDAMCHWPIDPSYPLGLLLKQDCTIVGHVFAGMSPDGKMYFATANHALAKATSVLTPFTSPGVDRLSEVVSLAWERFPEEDIAIYGGFELNSGPPDQGECFLFTYALGGGISKHRVIVQELVGSQYWFGQLSESLPPGTSGSPCISEDRNWVAIVVAVVGGGIELSPIKVV